MRLVAAVTLAAALASPLGSQPPTPAALRAAAEYSAARTGKALLVWHRGRLVLERYDGGWDAERPHYLASGTKSFAGLMAAAAADDGLLSLDEPVSATLTEWRGDARKSRITIRQLLSLVSGIDGENLMQRPKPVATAVALPARWEPGTTFRYAQEPFQLFQELLRRKLVARDGARALSADAWLEQRLLAPLGARVARWGQGGDDGARNLAGGAHMTARDWGRVGQLLLGRGTVDGRMLVRQATFAELVRGTAAMPAYGVTFWLNAPLPPGTVGPDERVPREVGRTGGRNTGAQAILPGGPRDLYMAAGAGMQRLYVIPSRELVIVRFGDNMGMRGRRGGGYSDAEFLRLVLGG